MKEKDRINKYLQEKFMSTQMPVYNIKYELEDGYEFGEVKAFGKIGFGIKKK